MQTNTDEDAQMMEALSKLDAQAQGHFRAIVRVVAHCYIHPQIFSGVLITRSGDETAMMCMNASDMEAADILAGAAEYMTAYTMHDAPPKDKFN
jgi:DNA topoisomerase IB